LQSVASAAEQLRTFSDAGDAPCGLNSIESLITTNLLYYYRRRCAWRREVGPLSKVLADERRPGRAILMKTFLARRGIVICGATHT
jgi:hypothetical protein